MGVSVTFFKIEHSMHAVQEMIYALNIWGFISSSIRALVRGINFAMAAFISRTRAEYDHRNYTGCPR